MRNKSKLAKIRKKSVPTYPREWMYMCRDEVRLAQIKEALEADYEMEYWDEAGVLEVELPSETASSVDFETVDMARADEMTDAYMKEHDIKTVFLVSIDPLDYEAAKTAMQKVIQAFGGFFCGDTPDLLPLVKS